MIALNRANNNSGYQIPSIKFVGNNKVLFEGLHTHKKIQLNGISPCLLILTRYHHKNCHVSTVKQKIPFYIYCSIYKLEYWKFYDFIYTRIFFFFRNWQCKKNVLSIDVWKRVMCFIIHVSYWVFAEDWQKIYSAVILNGYLVNWYVYVGCFEHIFCRKMECKASASIQTEKFSKSI